MISKDEIERKAGEFDITVANVERDYVFGWILAGIYEASDLSRHLVFKGGNCFRKAYFPATRFSKDLDFSTQARVDPVFLQAEFRKVCEYAQKLSGVVFEIERTRIEEQLQIDSDRSVYGIRIYFKDFYGNPDSCTISVSLDVVEFELIYLPTQRRNLIHPYSDADRCRAVLQCLKLEEMLAAKLKCLLQREHVADLFDLAYSVLVNRDVELNRRDVVSTFLKKTIFEANPLTAKQLLLDLPLHAFHDSWRKYIVCPVESLFDFDSAITSLRTFVESLFGGFVPSFAAASYFPSTAASYFPSTSRSTVVSATSNNRLLRMTYDGVTRLVEPYSLVFKRRADGLGQEYLYVYDRTGGRQSGPGVKSFIHSKIQRIEATAEEFAPRFAVDLARPGEFSRRSNAPVHHRNPIRGAASYKPRPLRRYTYQCTYCARDFVHQTRNTKLNSHNDGYGNKCYGRRGFLVSEEYG